MSDSHSTAPLARFDLLASALAGRELRVENAAPGAPAWTDGKVVLVAAAPGVESLLRQVCVQGALLAAGSLDPAIVRRLARRPRLARRYLAVEGQRALAALEDVLPPRMRPLIDRGLAGRVGSPAASLALATSPANIPAPPDFFGAIRPRALLAVQPQVPQDPGDTRHVPRLPGDEVRAEFREDADPDDGMTGDFASSPVGGGGALGRLLKKMLDSVRQVRGGGAPGADTASHWSRAGARAGVGVLSSAAGAERVDDATGAGDGIAYPEWNVHRRCYRPGWCTVREIEAPARTFTPVQWLGGYGLRRPLARLGMELDRFHRQAQGEDIDIDAAVAAQVAWLAGAAPDESRYIESQRRRRDLSVLILLDISGSVSLPGVDGPTVHQQQRIAAAELATVLYEIGDRVAIYAFHSQGRSAVHMLPVKRFDDVLDSTVMSRLHGLEPGAYSRLGAAIRHGTRQLLDHGGTSRRLLLLLSDGLAYDRGYEPAYGAADARQALREARHEGVGCLCLSIGASTDTDVLRRIFGNTAFATLPGPDQLGRVIGPLFRSALNAAEVQRRVA